MIFQLIKFVQYNIYFNIIIYGLTRVKPGWIEERIIDERYWWNQDANGLGVQIKVKWWSRINI